MKLSLEIQLASTKLLIYLVNDLLSFAQISAGKFRKEISVMDVRQTVKEVMLIQKHKALMMGIELSL